MITQDLLEVVFLKRKEIYKRERVVPKLIIYIDYNAWDEIKASISNEFFDIVKIDDNTKDITFMGYRLYLVGNGERHLRIFKDEE